MIIMNIRENMDFITLNNFTNVLGWIWKGKIKIEIFKLAY